MWGPMFDHGAAVAGRRLIAVVCLCITPLAGAHMMPGTMGPGMMGRQPDSGSGSGQRAPGGAVEFQQVCSLCHAPPNPGAHTADQWPGIVRRMEKYMSSQGMSLPDPQTIQNIEDYLKAQSQGH